jgi:hypothetical protein
MVWDGDRHEGLSSVIWCLAGERSLIVLPGLGKSQVMGRKGWVFQEPGQHLEGNEVGADLFSPLSLMAAIEGF